MKERLGTGIVAGGIFLAAVYFGGSAFILLIYAIAVMAYREFLKMMKIPLNKLEAVIGYVFLTLLMVVKCYEGYIGVRMEHWFAAIILCFLLMMLFSYSVENFNKIGTVMVALIYIGISFSSFAELRFALGLEFILFILLLIWATDSGAYLIGRQFGKRKLMERVSPNKTLEGAMGGILTTFLVVCIFYWQTDVLEGRLLYMFVLAILVSIAGQTGDLIESAMKRHFGVKDSGKILPGHGGILDRFDSLMFVCLLLFVVGLV